jgi:hypothetical protein
MLTRRTTGSTRSGTSGERPSQHGGDMILGTHREESTQAAEQGSVRPGESRQRGLAAKHCHLVAQDEALDVLGRV